MDEDAEDEDAEDKGGANDEEVTKHLRRAGCVHGVGSGAA